MSPYTAVGRLLRWLLGLPPLLQVNEGTNRFKCMRKIISEIHGLTWTLAGTGMVLITLSGSTRTLGIQITLVAIMVHMLGVLLGDKK